MTGAIDLDADVVVIGAGIVGAAVSAELARAGREVVVIEREAGPGRVTTSRNSGVIHAGFHYPEGSLKAETCIEGRALLYERAARLGIPHEKTGKLIVAVEPSELEALEAIALRSERLGVPIERWSAAKLAEVEPALRGVAALFSPESGIVDAHALVASYENEAKANGASFAWRTEVVAIEPTLRGARVIAENDRRERTTLSARSVVIAAGLEADRVLTRAGFDPDALGLRLHYAKGDYFVLGSRAPRPRTALVYPVPPAVVGLGIHLTRDLGGGVRAGPDAAFVDAPEYDVDDRKAAQFASAVARYLPGIEAEHLSADYAGVRPRLSGPGEPPRDFALFDGALHGFPSLVALVGIESPGLTAAAALARRVAALV